MERFNKCDGVDCKHINASQADFIVEIIPIIEEVRGQTWSSLLVGRSWWVKIAIKV
jgi:hypothetical protein